MTSTHVIILAQGDQKRLGDTAGVPKQLLRLPLHSEAIEQRDVTLLDRTLVQVTSIFPDCHITIVAGQKIVDHVKKFCGRTMSGYRGSYTSVFLGRIQVVTLAKPGNSSLRGLEQALSIRRTAQAGRIAPITGWPTEHKQTVVLLGDVLYSWEALRIAAAPDQAIGVRDPMTPMRFSTSSDLSPSGGELWSLSWLDSQDDRVFALILDALKKHPPFEGTYQPGQLRRILWEARANGEHIFHAQHFVDDYTMDVDLPEHLPLLATHSIRAFDDDRKEGAYVDR